MSRLPDVILKTKHIIFPKLWPFENLGILNFSTTYLQNCLSWKGLKFGQLIEDDE